ncbi:uncharacterized protein [Drosophila suzukii]|uniref:Uncharacterized protein n=1 Tax=Drosophila suzukii TaxID=28584 RepID=A0AB39YWA0_DROSZ
MPEQIQWPGLLALLLIMVVVVRGALDGSGRCGSYECRLTNPICRCESFCQESSQRCWKSPTGCHRDERGNCVPLIMCP